MKIRKFFKSDSEFFLTLKNGLEAGSCILQMFHMYVGMGEGGQDGKLNHWQLFLSFWLWINAAFHRLMVVIFFWTSSDIIIAPDINFHRTFVCRSGGLFGICGKWRPVAWETAVATVRLACVLPLFSIWQTWPQQSCCLWFSDSETVLFLSWLECLRMLFKWWEVARTGCWGAVWANTIWPTHATGALAWQWSWLKLQGGEKREEVKNRGGDKKRRGNRENVKDFAQN